MDDQACEARSREALTTKLSRARKFRQLEREYAEAKLISFLLQGEKTDLEQVRDNTTDVLDSQPHALPLSFVYGAESGSSAMVSFSNHQVRMHSPKVKFMHINRGKRRSLHPYNFWLKFLTSVHPVSQVPYPAM